MVQAGDELAAERGLASADVAGDQADAAQLAQMVEARGQLGGHYRIRLLLWVTNARRWEGQG
jgi:hypothetical protein